MNTATLRAAASGDTARMRSALAAQAVAEQTVRDGQQLIADCEANIRSAKQRAAARRSAQPANTSKIDTNPETNSNASYDPGLADLRATRAEPVNIRVLAKRLVDEALERGETVDSYEMGLAIRAAEEDQAKEQSLRESRMVPTRMGTKTHQHLVDLPGDITTPPDSYKAALDALKGDK